MKSIKLEIKICVLCIMMVLSNQIQTEKSETVLEFFNNLFTGNMNSESDRLGNEFLESSNEPTSVVTKTTTITSSFSSSNSTSGFSRNSTSSFSRNSSSNNITINSAPYANWLKLSSEEFKNKQKFPLLYLHNGESLSTKIDSNNFRINYAYDSNNNGKDTNLPTNPLNHWFRINGNQLFYTATKTDLNVLGVITFTTVELGQDENKFSINIVDNTNANWMISADNKIDQIAIFCAINKVLGKTPLECSLTKNTANLDIITQFPQPIIIEDKVNQPIILIPIASRTCNDKWDYTNMGNDWECTCSEGFEQSPIDLPNIKNTIESPVTPVFQYEEVSAKNELTTLDGELKANEYIKIKYFSNALRIFHTNFGKIVTLDGAVYIAEEIVFHTPSEHTIDGKRYDMEMQIIHYGQSQGDISKQVILSFLFVKTPGVYNKFIDDIDFFSLPNPIYPERDITNNLFIPKVFYSSNDENIPVMEPFSFYTYKGSLTSPPCTERTIHYVASKPIPIGSSSLDLMKEAIKQPDVKNPETGEMIVNSIIETNNRETQKRGVRSVFHYNHSKYCSSSTFFDPPKRVKKVGHYERVKAKVNEYFFVPSTEPSGLPGSFLVSEKEAKGLEN